jgi:membrane protease YdiL (CAAX protease family)
LVFSGLVLTLALGAGLLIRLVPMPQFVSFLVWGATPVLAVLLMMFVVSRDGLTRDGLRSLGLHRLGLTVWWIAFGVTLLVSVLATAAVVAFGFASVAAAANPLDTALNFVVSVGIVTVTFAAAEEIAFRGYLLPRLLPLGRNRALAITGLVHAAWHLPLILLTPLYHADGNLLIILPLFVATIVAAGFVFGDLRIATGSIWPAAIAHAVHNVAWDNLTRFTIVSSPVLVEEYLAGDTGVFILLLTAAGAVWLRSWVRRHFPQRA